MIFEKEMPKISIHLRLDYNFLKLGINSIKKLGKNDSLKNDRIKSIEKSFLQKNQNCGHV